MLQFSQVDTSVDLIVTLTEKVSISNANYLFVFEHIQTRNIVAFIKLSADDVSPYKGRYNQFVIDPSVVFNAQPIGQWNYRIYEQVSAINTDTNSTGSLLEVGKMKLDRAVDFEPTNYELATIYKAYNG